MKTEIYYFSGTGNSLTVARDFADKSDGKSISMATVVNRESVSTGADVIGIVFPVYHGGVPNIVGRFISRMDDINNKYIFGVCTYGDEPGIAMKYLSRTIESRGGKLASGFAVKMPYNYIDFSRSLREVSVEEQQEMFKGWRKKLESIHKSVDARETGRFETSLETLSKMVDTLRLREIVGKRVWLKRAGFVEHTDLTFWECIQLMDSGFQYDEECNGCDICSKVCPVSNIKMIDNRPSWQHRCEQCFACLQWCPKEAIQFGSRTSGGKRYHHPDVKISDMLRRD